MAERTPIDAARAAVAALGDAVDAAYVIGSAATGGFEAESSDLDVVGVLRGSPAREELARQAMALQGVDVSPARGLELVAYAGGQVVLNVNTGPGMTEHVGLAGDDPAFWFVLDRAIAEQHAIALVGPPWAERFAAVPRDEVLAALRESLDWHDAAEPASRNAVLNALRTWRWLETGEWVSKPDAFAWLVARLRAGLRTSRAP